MYMYYFATDFVGITFENLLKRVKTSRNGMVDKSI